MSTNTAAAENKTPTADDLYRIQQAGWAAEELAWVRRFAHAGHEFYSLEGGWDPDSGVREPVNPGAVAVALQVYRLALPVVERMRDVVMNDLNLPEEVRNTANEAWQRARYVVGMTMAVIAVERDCVPASDVGPFPTCEILQMALSDAYDLAKMGKELGYWLNDHVGVTGDTDA